MAVASFEDLCAGFCELAHVASPALAPDERGITACHVTLRDVTVNLIHCPDENADPVFVLFEFGTVDDTPNAHGALNELLAANFRQLHAQAPVYTRNPIDGQIVRRHVYSLSEATPNGLFDLIESGVAQALQWRSDHETPLAITPPLAGGLVPVGSLA